MHATEAQWALFHKLWGAAQASPNYVKADWMRMQGELSSVRACAEAPVSVCEDELPPAPDAAVYHVGPSSERCEQCEGPRPTLCQSCAEALAPPTPISARDLTDVLQAIWRGAPDTPNRRSELQQYVLDLANEVQETEGDTRGGTTEMRGVLQSSASQGGVVSAHAPDEDMPPPPPCSQCGGPHLFDTSIPSHTWNAVIRAANLPDYLCLPCIVKAFVEAGRSFTATLWGGGLHGDEIEVTVNSAYSQDVELLSQENNELRTKLRHLREDTHVCICGRYPHTPECAHR